MNRMPPFKICYICGRQFGTASIGIHVKACADKWEKQQGIRPPSERRPVPQMPPGYENILNGIGKSINRKDDMKLNELAFESFQNNRHFCPHCGRGFNPDSLSVHLRSCKPGNASAPRQQGIEQQQQQQQQDRRIRQLPAGGPPPYEIQMVKVEPGVQCRCCSRRFSLDRIDKHEAVCQGTPAVRKGQGMAKFVAEPHSRWQRRVSEGGGEERGGHQSKWRREHEEFITACREAKRLKKYMDSGGDISLLPPPKRSENLDYVFCNGCGRKYAPLVAERHIPKCASIINKPKPLLQKAEFRSSTTTTTPATTTKSDNAKMDRYVPGKTSRLFTEPGAAMPLISASSSAAKARGFSLQLNNAYDDVEAVDFTPVQGLCGVKTKGAGVSKGGFLSARDASSTSQSQFGVSVYADARKKKGRTASTLAGGSGGGGGGGAVTSRIPGLGTGAFREDKEDFGSGKSTGERYGTGSYQQQPLSTKTVRAGAGSGATMRGSMGKAADQGGGNGGQEGHRQRHRGGGGGGIAFDVNVGGKGGERGYRSGGGGSVFHGGADDEFHMDGDIWGGGISGGPGVEKEKRLNTHERVPLVKPANKHRGRPEWRPQIDDDDICGGGGGGYGGGLVARAGADDEAHGGRRWLEQHSGGGGRGGGGAEVTVHNAKGLAARKRAEVAATKAANDPASYAYDRQEYDRGGRPRAGSPSSSSSSSLSSSSSSSSPPTAGGRRRRDPNASSSPGLIGGDILYEDSPNRYGALGSKYDNNPFESQPLAMMSPRLLGTRTSTSSSAYGAFYK